jgi:hypothetical protein
VSKGFRGLNTELHFPEFINDLRDIKGLKKLRNPSW